MHVLFRRPPPILMGDHTEEVRHHNHISIRIGKDAGASIGLLVKDPSSESAAPIHLDVSFAEYLEREPRIPTSGSWAMRSSATPCSSLDRT